MGYFKQTVRGFTWMGGLRVTIRSLGFIKLAVLARLLAPEQFGVFGIAVLVLGFLEIITETGINVFLIQEKSDVRKFLNTAWVVSIIRGIIISLLIVLLSPLIASFFNTPQAYPILLLTALVPFIRGFINPAIIRFMKDLQFNKEFILRTILFSADALVAIALALITRSPASLVWGMIGAALMEVAISQIFIKPRPRFQVEKQHVKLVIGRGKWVTAAVFFNYLFQEGDDIAVGRLLSASALGIYQMAYKISTLPITEVSDVVLKVTFPIYVQMRTDTKRLKKAFLKTFTVNSLLVLPFGFLFFFFAREIILIVLGEAWLEAVPVLKVLSFFGVVRAITASTYPFFLSLKKQNYLTLITLVALAGLLVTIIPFLALYGIVGAGISGLTGALLAFPVSIVLVVRLFKQLK